MRIASLDGLRGVAVLLVLLHHHGLLNAGYVGVDLFFVLSGYLITTILREMRADLHYWRRFWTKRVARILPPLLLTLAATVLLGFAVSARQMMGYLLSFGDVLAYRRRDFETLQSLWSLAVEEHFYLLWPFAVRLLSRRSLFWLLGALLIVEPVARGLIAPAFGWRFVYYLTPFRLDGLCLGSLLALLFEDPRWKSKVERWSGSGMALGMLVWAGLRIGLGHAFTREGNGLIYESLNYSLLSGIAFALIAYLLTHPDSILSRVFSWNAFVFVGGISYGLYLYQVPLRDVLVRWTGMSVQHVLWFSGPLVVLVSWLSFRFYELPVMRWGKRAAESRG